MTISDRTAARLAALVLVVGGLAVGCDTTEEGATPTSVPTTTTPTTGMHTTADDGRTEVLVFFVDQPAFEEGVPPFTVAVKRRVAGANVAQGALDALFDGPTAGESRDGLRLVASGAAGVSDVRIEEGVAHVQLAGGCSSGGSTLTVAEEITRTMLQFAEVRAVKIYDPQGNTESPDSPGDSIPVCLEP